MLYAAMTIVTATVIGCAGGSGIRERSDGGVGVGGPDLADHVEVLRTEYGVPHILAKDLRALGFGLGYCQTEDYGNRVVHGLIRSNGRLGMFFGADSIESDFDARRARRRAAETYPLLSQDARDLMEGFAAGVNRYMRRHPQEFARWGDERFTGEDVHGSFILTTGPGDARRFRERVDSGTAVIFPAMEEGSNAWALAPSRTASGNAMLLRNPHLSWDAGYYEVHLVVPGVLNWYGDVRIGQPLYYIGGFNERLGWATTNNEPDLDEVYAFEADTTRSDHYLLDGRSVPLQREVVTVEFQSDTGTGTATREVWTTPYGPVIDRRDGKIFVFTAGYDGAFRMVDQYLGMIRARNLEEWLEAMRVRAHESSNFTYADADGNIFYLWNASLPDRPHPPAGDTAAVLVHRSSEMWHDMVPFDALPRLRNPKGGYTHNENDPFYFTNLNEPFDTAAYGPNYPRPRLRLRSQLGLQLIQALPAKATLEDVIVQKHIPRMLLADRLKDDLVAAVRESDPTGDVRDAVELLEAWDNTTARESRGGVLFQTWYTGYLEGAGTDEPRAPDWGAAEAFRVPWRSEEPTTTPRGLGDPAAGVRAFAWAVAKMQETYGAFDVPWGEVHRARRGDLDLPVSGCPGWLGCFRTIYFDDAEDGRKVASGGDGWVFAVEFGDIPRAYSVLAYGESNRADSPHATDQLVMFTEGRMKEVAFSLADIERQLIRRYRPGRE
jgi:acyl-homoserine-lactone acylase